MRSNDNLNCLFQERSLLAVAGKVVKGGLPVLMNCPDTDEPTQVRRNSPVPCVTGASWGVTIWPSMPGVICQPRSYQIGRWKWASWTTLPYLQPLLPHSDSSEGEEQELTLVTAGSRRWYRNASTASLALQGGWSRSPAWGEGPDGVTWQQVLCHRHARVAGFISYHTRDTGKLLFL